MISRFTVHTRAQGLHEITPQVHSALETTELQDGLLTVFVRHTSASLIIQENADPSAADDLERWFCRLVPEHDTLYRHTAEGPDDMPSHIKAALTASSLSIPITEGQLVLGTWQGIYLWEHRTSAHRREIVLHLLDDSQT